MTQSSASPEQQADDSSDDNVDDNLAPPAPSLTGSRCRSRARQRTCALLGVKGSQGVTVIIVSEPSAKVARRIRAGRSTPARSRSSAAHNDIPRYAGTHSESAFTQKRSTDQDLSFRWFRVDCRQDRRRCCRVTRYGSGREMCVPCF
jgi:hypothetical protein